MFHTISRRRRSDAHERIALRAAAPQRRVGVDARLAEETVRREIRGQSGEAIEREVAAPLEMLDEDLGRCARRP
ncbi:MAG: hypothetical protein HYX56_07310 [Chloroflexi bacterium]|nr:hypothetical protein [Chloroflexota bacterium]